MLDHQTFNRPYFMLGIAIIPGKRYWLKPKLRDLKISLDVDMSGFDAV